MSILFNGTIALNNDKVDREIQNILLVIISFVDFHSFIIYDLGFFCSPCDIHMTLCEHLICYRSVCVWLGWERIIPRCFLVLFLDEHRLNTSGNSHDWTIAKSRRERFSSRLNGDDFGCVVCRWGRDQWSIWINSIVLQICCTVTTTKISFQSLGNNVDGESTTTSRRRQINDQDGYRVSVISMD